MTTNNSINYVNTNGNNNTKDNNSRVNDNGGDSDNSNDNDNNDDQHHECAWPPPYKATFSFRSNVLEDKHSKQS